MAISEHWKVLGLDAPAQDKKAVKKAYAVQLKNNRPDEDPEGFKKLRQAYEFALAYVENPQEGASPSIEWRDLEDVLVKNNPNEINLLDDSHDGVGSVDDPDSENEISLVEDEKSFNVDNLKEKHLKEKNLQEEQQKEFERKASVRREVLVIVNALVESPERANQPENWAFISEYPELFDEEFNWLLGLSIFESLNRLIPENFVLKDGVALPINLEVIIYLDGMFNWIDQITDLEYELDSEEYTILFKILAFCETYAHANRGHGVKGGTVVGNQEIQASIQSVGSIFYMMAGLVGVILIFAMMVVD